MHKTPLIQRQVPAWQRLAACFGFLALVAGLLAPTVMLAEDMRTGKLGGLCFAGSAPDASGTDDVLVHNAHCASCTLLAFALPPVTAQIVRGKSDQYAASAHGGFGLAALVAGLPPSRGPPRS